MKHKSRDMCYKICSCNSKADASRFEKNIENIIPEKSFSNICIKIHLKKEQLE